jgi:hypothetical protein
LARKPFKGLSIILVGLLLSAASCQSLQFVDVITPQNNTETGLTLTFDRIQTYWNRHGRVPKNPADLPDLPGRDCEMRDGWGREFHWKSDGKRTVWVWSLGRDGKPGGSGEDADLVITFEGKRKGQEDSAVIMRRDMRE